MRKEAVECREALRLGWGAVESSGQRETEREGLLLYCRSYLPYVDQQLTYILLTFESAAMGSSGLELMAGVQHSRHGTGQSSILYWGYNSYAKNSLSTENSQTFIRQKSL